MPEIQDHCKWLEMMHGKACDKAGIGDGPLVFESEEYCEEKFVNSHKKNHLLNLLLQNLHKPPGKKL